MDMKEKVIKLRILKLLKDDRDLRDRVIEKHYNEFGEDYDTGMRDLEIESNLLTKLIEKIERNDF